ncbi:MAG TPA: HDOD domain-containing protein [Acidimicrobiales bacterium]|nr:HDOD domain-containing protein [Acidimicrobiales bacterium]
MAVVETLVGRQPIFDRDLTVQAYQLLFQTLDTDTSDTSVGSVGSVGHRSPEHILGSGADNLADLVGTKRAFCNASRAIVTGETPILASPDRVVVEIRGGLIDGETDLAGCRRLKDSGYTIAVDDVHDTEFFDQLLEMASVVKIDAEAVERERLPQLLADCRRFKVELIAENVDTPAKLGRCESLGFDYFQGYLLSRSHATPGGPPSPGRLAGLRMSARLLDAECPIGEIEEIIRSDPAMTHQVLQLAGIGAAGGMRRTVRTIRQALVLVGWRRLQSWVALLLLTDDGKASEEQIASVLMRARMSELLAKEVGCKQDACYTAGLLSTLDIVLGMPIQKIVETLPLDEELSAAVLTGEGPLGRLIADVADYQLGRPELAVRSAIREDVLRVAALDALTWTVGMTTVLETVEQA